MGAKRVGVRERERDREREKEKGRGVGVSRVRTPQKHKAVEREKKTHPCSDSRLHILEEM